MTYSRDDVQTHYGSDRPAVNVKVYGNLSDGFRDLAKYASADFGEIPEGFTEEWVRETFSDDYLDESFWMTCRFEWEMVEQDAEEIFGKGTTLEQDGRSGGWAVVTSLPPIEEWDAIMLGKWRRFEKYAQAIAADVPYQMVSGLLMNEWEWRVAEEAESQRAANQDIATVAP